MLVIKKTLIALLTTSLLTTATAVPIISKLDYQDPYYQSDDELLLKKMIHQNIDSDSIYFKTETKYKFQNGDYKDRDVIVNKFLEKNPILAEKTSSNPSKIIKEYEYQQLDEKRVYDVNQNNYVKVYKNALGKVVLPTCATSTPGQKGCVVSEKTAQQRALDSYVNGGLIRPKYTYAFGGSQNWYDSPTEAENAYKNSNFTIKKSLFYYYNGQYYNAFNQSDFEVLKNTQLNAGYYFEGADKNDDSVDSYQDIKTFWNTNSSFEVKLKQGLSKIFQENINNLFTYETKIVIQITPPKGEWISSFHTSNKRKISFNDKTNQLIISNDLRIGGLALPQLLNDLHDPSSKWSHEMIWYGCCSYDYNRHIFKDKIGDVEFGFDLNTTGDGRDLGFQETHPAQIQTSLVENTMNQNISLEYKTSNSLLNKIKKLPFPSSNFNIKDIVANIDLHNEVKTDDLTMSIYRRFQPSNWDQRFKDKMFEIYYDRLKKGLFSKSSPLVHQDWTYGLKNNPAEFSVYQSKKEYENEILNKKIKHTTDNDDEQITWSSSAGDFTTSWKNWKDNFYYLQQSTGIKQIPLKLMYYVDTNQNKDISEFSDFTGQTMACSTVQAKNIAFMSSEKILRKQYFIYDINGQVSISASDEQSAVAKLRNKVNLDYTYMNINETKQINDQDLNWKDIITDGLYTVYKFKSSSGWLYFMSYESAYKQFQNQIGLITGISQETVTYYRYVFNYNNQKYIFDWSNDQQIDEIVKKIYQIMKQ